MNINPTVSKSWDFLVFVIDFFQICSMIEERLEELENAAGCSHKDTHCEFVK